MEDYIFSKSNYVWDNSQIRTYLNSEIYNALPTGLKGNIINTNVISKSMTSFSETENKLYLFSVWELLNHDNNYSSGINSLGTRQLDYYSSIGVTSTPNSGLIKKYNNVAKEYWTRDMYPESNDNSVYVIGASGDRFGNGNGIDTRHGLSFAFRLNDDNTVDDGSPHSFAKDSWSTIATAVRSGDYPYQVGDTKKIIIKPHHSPTYSTSGGWMTYPYTVAELRIVNTSQCTNGETSETACGFVVEFKDLIARGILGANGAGWLGTSSGRTYLDSYLFNALPEDLKNVISDTQVKSNANPSASSVSTSTDKLYLFSPKELVGTKNLDSLTNLYVTSDPTSSLTRQLDYYLNSSNSLIKNYVLHLSSNSSNTYWTRTMVSSSSGFVFNIIQSDGTINQNGVNQSHGFAPAFRIT